MAHSSRRHTAAQAPLNPHGKGVLGTHRVPLIGVLWLRCAALTTAARGLGAGHTPPSAVVNVLCDGAPLFRGSPRAQAAQGRTAQQGQKKAMVDKSLKEVLDRQSVDLGGVPQQHMVADNQWVHGSTERTGQGLQLRGYGECDRRVRVDPKKVQYGRVLPGREYGYGHPRDLECRRGSGHLHWQTSPRYHAPSMLVAHSPAPHDTH